MSTATRREARPGARVRPSRPLKPAVFAAALLLLLAAPGPTPGRAQTKPSAPRPPAALTIIASHGLTTPEPSDLAIDETGKVLWTVADKPGRVFELDLQGRVVKTLAFVGEDLEGVAYDPSDRTLWVAEENRREIIHLDREGKVLSRHRLDLTGEKNSGLEGICLDADGRMFAVNEKKPGLFLEINGDRAIAARREVTFARDYSGMTYDPKRNGFWIVSDLSQTLTLWSRKAGVLEQYGLPFPKAEGIAVDEKAKRIYIVSDSENRLYVFRLPGG